MRLRIKSAGILFAGSVFFLGACAKPEQSVKPGINDRFKGEMQVDEWVARFESESREVFQHRDAVIDALNIETGMHVADIGAGTGFYSFEFARRVGADGRVYAVDIARPFLDRIETEAANRALTSIETIQCPENSTGLKSDSVDLAFICDTYHHFEFPMSTLGSLYRAVRPGGRIVIIDFVRHDAEAGQDDAKWMALPQERRTWIAGHVRCDRQTIIDECRMAGFEVADDQLASINGLLAENHVLILVKPRQLILAE